MPTTPNLDNVKLGSCSVVWGSDDLGYTKGGIDVSIKTATKEVKVDQFGESSVNEYLMGRMVEVKVPMAEADINKLVLAIPGSTLVIGTGPAQGKNKLMVGTSAGLSLRSLAKKLVLHPTGVPDTDKNDDFVVLKAAPAGDIEFSYNFDDQRVYMVTFKGYPDNSTGALFVIGDEAAA